MNSGQVVRAALLALPLALAGCAGLQPQAGDPAAAARADAREFRPALDMSGRISVRYEGRSGEEALHGSFQWSQDPTATSITLLSPLGQTVARIDVTPAGASMVQAGQPPRSAADVDTLTAETLGWPLPVSGMREWLQGFAIDATGKPFIASPRMNAITTRDGWHIQYPAWQDAGAASARPRRVDLARRTAQAGEVAIRIVIDTWQPR